MEDLKISVICHWIKLDFSLKNYYSAAGLWPKSNTTFIMIILIIKSLSLMSELTLGKDRDSVR